MVLTTFKNYKKQQMQHDDYIEQLIAKEKIELAIKEFMTGTKLNEQSDLYSSLILISGQFYGNKQDKIRNLLSEANYRTTLARIRHSLNEYLKEYKPLEGYEFDNILETETKPSVAPIVKNTVIVITATTTETRGILKVFKEKLGAEIKMGMEGRQAVNYLGQINQTQIIHTQCEAGSGGAAGAQAAATNLINRLKPSSVIMPGIAFGLQKSKQSIGDILVPTHIRQYEKTRVGENETFERGDRIPPSSNLLSLLRLISSRWEEPKIHFGPIVSGEKLVDNKEFVEYLLKKEPEAIGGEMEGVGLYSAAYGANVDWILFKAIVDWGEGKTDDFQKKSSEKVAELLFEVLTILVSE